LSVTQFWMLVADVFPPRRARALVTPLVKAGLLGGVAGSLLASSLAGPLGTLNLLLVALAFLLAAGPAAGPVLTRAAGGHEAGAPARAGAEAGPGYLRGLRTVFKSRYLVFMSGAMVAAMTVTTLLDFQFNSILQSNITSPDQRTAFLGVFFTVLLVVSFALQSGLTHFVLKRFGLRTALLVTPVVLLIGVAAVPFAAAAAALPWAVAVKGADKSLTHTFSQSTREILYVPVPSDVRAKAKPFIDMFLNKLGDGTAALLIAGSMALFGEDWKNVSVVTAIGLILWIALNLGIMREYGGVVKRNLRVRWPDAGRVVLDHVDVDSAKLVFETLESRNRSSILYAMNLMDLVQRERLTPELREILKAGAATARAGALGALFDAGGSAVPEWDDALEETGLDTEVRDVLSLDVYQEVMKRRFEDWAGRPAADDASAMEAAKAIGLMPAGSPLVGHLRRLLRSESADVVRYALESAGRQGRREDVPLILARLADAGLREAAAAALAAYGDRIAGTLGDRLADPGEDPSVRRAIPDVLACGATPRAAAVLVRALARRDAETRGAVLAALVRVRERNPALAFRPGDIRPAIAAEAGAACDAIEALARRKNGAGSGAADEEAALGRSLQAIFDLLSLIYPYDDIHRAWQNYSRGERRAVDSSIDLLENLLRREDKEIVLPLIEEGPADEKARRCRAVRARLRV
jgi:HEAT repeat protein